MLTHRQKRQGKMGTVCQNPPPLIHDLKVRIHSASLVFPSSETERKSMFLSNIDKVLNFNVQTVHFFQAHPDFPPPTVAEKLETALKRALVPYDFLAGRLKMNPELDRLEVDCNAAGAGFVVASSEFTLDEIGDLVYPNPAFQQLTLMTMDDFPPHDQPLCILQVTSFKCGGFAMGVTNNHATFDGLSFKIFLDNLASLAADKPLAVTPCNDRQLLAARSPPRVEFPHPELLKLKIPIGEESVAPIMEPKSEELSFKIFRLTSEDINNLKAKAEAEAEAEAEGVEGKIRVTGFNVVTTHIWRCKALSCGGGEELDRESTVLYAVDIRRRLDPPLPPSYTGNAVLTAYATASCRDLREQPFSKLVGMVSEGATRMTNEYARSAIDWGEVHKGFPHGEFLISSWWRLGFAEVEYPWGKAKYSCPVVYHRKDIILLFPDIDPLNNNGVNVLAALPTKEMEKFQTLFLKFLA